MKSCFSGRDAERGGVLVFVALALFLIVGIVGLAIDLNIGLSGRTDQQQLANALATAALETYLAEGANNSPIDEKIRAARDRIVNLGSYSKNAPIYRNSTRPLNLCLKSSSDATCPSDAEASLTSGYWFPEITAQQPCGDDAKRYPCFVAGSGQLGEITGFQVEIFQSSESPIKSIFAGLLGVASMRTSASATASVIPRHIVFSADVSASVVGTSHDISSNDLNRSQRRAYAYKLEAGITCTGSHGVSLDPCQFPGSDRTDVYISGGDCTGIKRGGVETFGNWWYATPATVPASGIRGNIPGTNKPEHYKEDYQCWDVNDDGSGEGVTHYLIDMHSAPEPLNSILNAISSAVEEMEVRRNAGDRIQLSFFDSKVFDFREVPLLPANSAEAFQLAAVDETRDANYREIKAILGTAQDRAQYPPSEATLTKRITEHAIFPRVNPLTKGANLVTGDMQEGGVFTNIAYSSWRAGESLIRNGLGTYARRDVVMFSDFIPNCRFASGRTPNGVDPWCSNEDEPGNLDIIRGIIFNIEDQYGGAKIAFNPIMIGDYVRPHTTLPLDGNGGCLWDQSTIRTKVPGIESDNHYNMNSYVRVYGGGCLRGPKINPNDPDEIPPCVEPERPADPYNPIDSYSANPPYSYYFRPAYFYESAVKTGGEWGVVRPACLLNGDAANVKENLQRLCSRFERAMDCARVNDHCPVGYVNPGYNYVGLTEGWLDSQGRLVCDPDGRPQARQISDYMQNIMGSNSIVLVYSKS